MNVVTLFYICAAIASTVYIFIKWKLSYWKRKGIDFIEPDFFFGNTKASTKKEIHKRDLYRQFYDYFKSRGKSFGGIYDFTTPHLFITDLNLIKHVLQIDFANFTNRPGYVNENADPINAHLFNIKDAKWKNMRAKLTPTFTTGKLKMMFETMVQTTSSLEKILNKYATLNDPVFIKQVLLLFTTDIITSVAFGLELNSLENPDTEYRKKFDSLFVLTPKKIASLIISETVPDWILDIFKLRIIDKDVEDFIMNEVKNMIDYREKNQIYRKDFLHLLIQIKNMGQTTDDGQLKSGSDGKHLSITDVAAQCFLFYIGGFETSSTTMTFAFLELAQHIDIQNKLREEIESVLKKHNNEITYDAIMEMKYLENVIQETLRKHSAVLHLRRECNKTYKIPNSDVVIEKGTKVLIPIYGLHYDPEYYPDPDAFIPDRFNKENKNSIPQYAYLPFGEGPRNCIGLRFGKLQTKIGICAIIRKFKMTLNEKTQLPIKYTLAKVPDIEGGLWLNLEKI